MTTQIQADTDTFLSWLRDDVGMPNDYSLTTPYSVMLWNRPWCSDCKLWYPRSRPFLALHKDLCDGELTYILPDRLWARYRLESWMEACNKFRFFAVGVMQYDPVGRWYFYGVASERPWANRDKLHRASLVDEKYGRSSWMRPSRQGPLHDFSSKYILREPEDPAYICVVSGVHEV